MESLKFTSLIPCKSSVNLIPTTKFVNHEVIGQVGFVPLWKRRSTRPAFRLRAQVSGGSGGAQDGASALEDQREEKGVLLGAETDSSGSVIGFNLIPPNGMFVCLYFQACFSIWLWLCYLGRHLFEFFCSYC